MDIYKIDAVVRLYLQRFREENIPQQRIDIDTTFGDHTPKELLAHAHYLAANMQIFMFAKDKFGKANRHLTAIQMCLSFAGWYTLEELMDHNRSGPHAGPQRTHQELTRHPNRSHTRRKESSGCKFIVEDDENDLGSGGTVGLS